MDDACCRNTIDEAHRGRGTLQHCLDLLVERRQEVLRALRQRQFELGEDLSNRGPRVCEIGRARITFLVRRKPQIEGERPVGGALEELIRFLNALRRVPLEAVAAETAAIAHCRRQLD